MKHLYSAFVVAALVPSHSLADTFYDSTIAERGGTTPCFAGIFDEAHLSKHPRQRVTHFFLRHSEAEDLAPPQTFDIVIGYRLKGSADSFVTEAGCAEEASTVICYAEGDAGSFKLAGNADQVIVTIDERLHLEGRTSFSPDLAKGGGDSPILLHPRPANDCRFD